MINTKELKKLIDRRNSTDRYVVSQIPPSEWVAIHDPSLVQGISMCTEKQMKREMKSLVYKKGIQNQILVKFNTCYSDVTLPSQYFPSNITLGILRELCTRKILYGFYKGGKPIRMILIDIEPDFAGSISIKDLTIARPKGLEVKITI